MGGMSKIVQGSISPIRADKLRMRDMRIEGEVIEVPIPPPDGVHHPRLISDVPLVVAPETIAHARTVAQALYGRFKNLPVNKEAGDLISLALTVLHYTKEPSDVEE